MTCPCCGAPVSANRLLVDLNTNIAVYDGIEVEIRPAQVAELVYALAEAWPKTVSNHDIAHAIWGMFEPDCLTASIQTHVCWARKFMGRFGFAIERAGRGYRLVAPDQPLATAWAIEQRAAS